MEVVGVGIRITMEMVEVGIRIEIVKVPVRRIILYLKRHDLRKLVLNLFVFSLIWKKLVVDLEVKVMTMPPLL